MKPLTASLLMSSDLNRLIGAIGKTSAIDHVLISQHDETWHEACLANITAACMVVDTPTQTGQGDFLKVLMTAATFQDDVSGAHARCRLEVTQSYNLHHVTSNGQRMSGLAFTWPPAQQRGRHHGAAHNGAAVPSSARNDAKTERAPPPARQLEGRKQRPLPLRRTTSSHPRSTC